MTLVKKLRRFVRDQRAIKWYDKVSDMIDAYPFDIGLSLALVLFGIRSLVTGLQAAPGSVQALPIGLAILYCGLAAVGGLSVVLGIAGRVFLSWAYGLEKFGLYISASAWGAYIVGLVFAPITGKSTLLILALGALVFGCIRRARAIKRKEHAELEALRTEKKNREEGE